VQQILLLAAERGVGQFKLRNTNLLPQGGPEPETREQYIRDLADGMASYRCEELGLFRMPTELPDTMAAHRERLMDEYAGEVLRARARYPGVGHRWVQDSIERLRKTLEEVDTRAEAVMTYELERLNPQDVSPGERIRWAVPYEYIVSNARKPSQHLHQLGLAPVAGVDLAQVGLPSQPAVQQPDRPGTLYSTTPRRDGSTWPDQRQS
jgi:hypothetical protein